MLDGVDLPRDSKLDRTTWPEFRDRIVAHDQAALPAQARQYPGYPAWPLDPVAPRWWPPLDRVLKARRSRSTLKEEVPARRTLSRILAFAHGITGEHDRGPAPSAGGLQALELYLATWTGGWLPAGLYHFNRPRHELCRLAAPLSREQWLDRVPSLATIEGGALLWVLVGDGARVEDKYGPRGLRFLLLEAGHLMQNLALASSSLGWTTVPVGGFFEGAIAQMFLLPRSDVVLYLGLCGKY